MENQDIKIKTVHIEMINLDDVQSIRYDENIELYGDHSDTCFLCGKRTSKNLYVHYTTDGYLVNVSDDIISNSQGFFPIGSECAKKLPKSFIF